MATETIYRRTGPLMRIALLLGAGFSFVSAVQLFVLTDHTDTLFAWTIEAGPSATLLSSFYMTACVIALMSWRRQPWMRARVGIPGVVIFLWATLLATMLHLDKFHLTVGGLLARGAAWAWVVVYVLDPILITAALIVQWRMQGEDPPRTARLGNAYRGFLAVSAALLAGAGLAMTIVPDLAIRLAPWALTPLTSRAVGAVAFGAAGVLATMWWENDHERIRPAVIGLLVAPTLMLIGLLRYIGDYAWGGGAPIYVGIIAMLATAGIWGLAARVRG